MNFPDSQLVAEDSELAVRQLFTRWRWVVAKDYIDVGYDFVVSPDKDTFNGARSTFRSRVRQRREGGPMWQT